MSQWIRAFAQTTTYLGVVMIAAIWGGIYFLTVEAHDRAYEDGLRQGSNLTRVFEEYIAHAISGIDGQLLVFRKLYGQDPAHFAFDSWIDSATTQSNLTVHFSITGPDGIIRLSSLGPVSSIVDISDREPFRVHVGTAADELYISQPSVGHLSGKPSIQLTRRLLDARRIVRRHHHRIARHRRAGTVLQFRRRRPTGDNRSDRLRRHSSRPQRPRHRGEDIRRSIGVGAHDARDVPAEPGRQLLELAQHRHLRARQAADLLPGGRRIAVARHRRIGRGRHLSASGIDRPQIRSDRPVPDRDRAVRDRHRGAAAAQARAPPPPRSSARNARWSRPTCCSTPRCGTWRMACACSTAISGWWSATGAMARCTGCRRS